MSAIVPIASFAATQHVTPRKQAAKVVKLAAASQEGAGFGRDADRKDQPPDLRYFQKGAEVIVGAAGALVAHSP